MVVSGLEAGGQAQLRYPDIEDGAVLLAVDDQTCRGMSLARCGSLIRGSLLGDASDDPRKRKSKRVALTFSHRFQVNCRTLPFHCCASETIQWFVRAELVIDVIVYLAPGKQQKAPAAPTSGGQRGIQASSCANAGADAAVS